VADPMSMSSMSTPAHSSSKKSGVGLKNSASKNLKSTPVKPYKTTTASAKKATPKSFAKKTPTSLKHKPNVKEYGASPSKFTSNDSGLQGKLKEMLEKHPGNYNSQELELLESIRKRG
jgi:hypothetical protein